MAKKLSELANELKPFIQEQISSSLSSTPGIAGYAPSPHDISGVHHYGTLATSQYPNALLRDGSRSLTGNLTVAAGITIDGVDISVLNDNFNTHDGQDALTAHGSLGTTLTAGAGLTATGTLDSGAMTIDVGAGDGITVNADTVALSTPGTLSHSSSNSSIGNHTHAVTTYSDVVGGTEGILASDASGNLYLSSLGVGIASLSAVAHIYGTAPQLRLDNGGGDYADFSVDGNGNLTVAPVNNFVLDPVGDVVLGPASNDTLPDFNYNINLGSPAIKFLTMHVAELWADTLVAQETIATIGGYIKVAPTTELISDIAEDITAGINFILNGTFEDVTTNDFADWTESAGDGSITDETTIVYAGSHAVKITRGTGSIFVSQDVTVVPGSDYTFEFYARGDGTYSGRYRIRDITNAADITALTSAGVTAATYTKVTDTFTAPAGCTTVRLYLYDTGTNSTSCYFDNAEFYLDATINMDVKHNQMVAGDIVMMMKDLKLEYFEVLSGPTPVTVDTVNGYRYSVQRNLDQTGGNEWLKGDAVLNTGQTGSGFIDIYSLWGHNALGVDYIYIDDGTVFGDNLRGDQNFELFPTTAVANDAIYFGMGQRGWRDLYFNVVTAGSYTATFAYEFWNGSAWTAMTLITTPDFTSTGTVAMEWWQNNQTDWAATTVNGISAYWVRIRVASVTTWTTSPVQGSQRIVREANQWGPTIAGYVRDSITWNDVGYRWVAGNLDGFYGKADTFGFAAGTYQNNYNFITMTDADGFEIFNRSAGSDVRIGHWDVDGTITVGDTGDHHITLATTGIQLKDGTTVRIDIASSGTLTVGSTSAEAVQIDATNGLRLYSAGSVRGRFATDGVVWLGSAYNLERLSWDSTNGLQIYNHSNQSVLHFDTTGNAYLLRTLAISSNGAITVGATNVKIDVNGITVAGSSSSYGSGYIEVKEAVADTSEILSQRVYNNEGYIDWLYNSGARYSAIRFGNTTGYANSIVFEMYTSATPLIVSPGGLSGSFSTTTWSLSDSGLVVNVPVEGTYVYGTNSYNFAVYRTSNLALDGSSVYGPQFGATRRDNRAMHSGSVFTAPFTGWYIITGNAEFSASASGYRSFGFSLNPTIDGSYKITAEDRILGLVTENAPDGSNSTHLHHSIIVYLTSGDEVAFRVFSSAAVNLVGTNAYSPEWGAAYLGS